MDHNLKQAAVLM